MKKSIIITFFILLLTNIAYSNSIPGELELDLSFQQYNNTYHPHLSYMESNIYFKYGASHDWLQPYLFGQFSTQFQRTDNILSNYPFRDVYTFGVGIQFFKIAYFEASHICSHQVISQDIDQEEIYNSMTNFTHNTFKIGLRFHID